MMMVVMMMIGCQIGRHRRYLTWPEMTLYSQLDNYGESQIDSADAELRFRLSLLLLLLLMVGEETTGNAANRSRYSVAGQFS